MVHRPNRPPNLTGNEDLLVKRLTSVGSPRGRIVVPTGRIRRFDVLFDRPMRQHGVIAQDAVDQLRHTEVDDRAGQRQCLLARYSQLNGQQVEHAVQRGGGGIEVRAKPNVS